MVDGKEVSLAFKDQRVHLDVTDNVQVKDKALSLGRRRDQISVWDVANFEEIQTGGQGGQVSKNGTVERGGDTETVGRYERRGDRRLGTDGVGKDDGSDSPLTKFNAHHDSAGRFASSDAAYVVRYRGDDLEDGHAIVEAHLNDTVIGALRWDYYAEPPTVVDVSVDSNYRRQGVATKLFDTALNQDQPNITLPSYQVA